MISTRNPSVSKEFLENLEKRTANKSESFGVKNVDNPLSHEKAEELVDSSNDSASFLWEESNAVHAPDQEVEEKELCCSEEAPKRSLANCLSDRDWLNELEYLFAAGLLDELKDTLQRSYNETENPFEFILFIMTFADHDIFSGKKSLVHMALAEFESWLEDKNKRMGEMGREMMMPTRQQQDNALEIVVTSKLLFFESIKRIFKLDCANNEFLEKHIRYLLHTGRRYKEVNINTYLFIYLFILRGY